MLEDKYISIFKLLPLQKEFSEDTGKNSLQEKKKTLIDKINI